jgi:hypothetical protein
MTKATKLIPMPDLIFLINRAFRRWTDAMASTDRNRIEAGRLLIEARQRVLNGEEQGLTWEKWCCRNIPRSQADIRKCMALASADDPQAALEQERAGTRQRMQNNRAHVRAVKSGQNQSLSLDELVEAFRALTRQEQREFWIKIKGEYDEETSEGNDVQRSAMRH